MSLCEAISRALIGSEVSEETARAKEIQEKACGYGSGLTRRAEKKSLNVNVVEQLTLEDRESFRFYHS